MQILQEKLKYLLNKYLISKTVVLNDKKTAVIDGIYIPLLSHRYERRFIELKNLVNNGTLVGISAMRVASITERGGDVYAELYRELDICQFVLQRSIKSITVMENGNVLNAIATTEDGVVCTIEISCTLACGEPPKDKHEIISQRGIACDVVVDAQLKQDSIYVFGSENKKFTDVDFELYGLPIEDIAVVRAAFAAAQSDDPSLLIDTDENLKKLIKLAHVSAESGERTVL